MNNYTEQAYLSLALACKALLKNEPINDVALILWLGCADRVPDVLWVAGRAPEIAVAISVL